MENITLTKQQVGSLLKGFGALTVLVFVVLSVSGGALSAPSTRGAGLIVLRALTSSLTASGVIFALFQQSIWRWWFFPRLVKRPIIAGVWLGQLTSNYKPDPASAEPDLVIPIVFVIRQSLMTISVQSFTRGQGGESTIEAILHNSRTGDFRLTYVFELKHTYAGSNELTHGAGDLGLYEEGRVLEGRYWTNNPTHGTLRLERVPGKHVTVQRFEDALREYPGHPAFRT